MDPGKTYLGRLLLEEITPVVMVLTTPLVEDSCRKNGISFVEMLQPFSLFHKIDVPIRTASDQPYRLQMFKLRLAYASNVKKQNLTDGDERLMKLVDDAEELSFPDLHSEPPQLETLIKKPESDLLPTWIKTFNKELVRTISFSEHETFDHPVACLLVASSQDDQPISCFVDLFNSDHLSSLLNEGVVDPKIMKNFLLLHDNHDGTTERATGILSEMRSTFGSNDCKLICINSSKGADDAMLDNPWLAIKHDGWSERLATLLNMDDIIEIKDFMQYLACNHIIPYMEQKIRALNQQVSVTRKGFRNQIKNLWWRKGKEDIPEAPTGPTYTSNSIESQIRVLGDYAFMLRDYELALSNYRLLSTDYKLDKAWKHYAGVQEMCGLCYFMQDQSRKESEYCMDNAFSTYLKIGSSGQRFATRCGIWWAEMLMARGQYKEASNVYSRISNEEPSMHAAVFLEQAASCFLLSNPPMVRKYGFHLILAGNRYYISDQKKHAIRVYRNALLVYTGSPWSSINDHVHFNIGRWYGLLGMFDVAIKYMLEVLACSHQSPTMQNMFLSDFFHFVQSVGNKINVCKLQLPIINMSSLRIVHEDHHTYASAGAVDVSESIWQDFEEEMAPSTALVRSNWLDSQPKSSPLKNNGSSICVAGESVKVDLELKNPLGVAVSVSGVALICELSGTSGASINDTTSLPEADGKDCVSTDFFNKYQDADSTSYTLSKVDLVLGGGESKTVQLEVTPKVEGILKLVGIRWALSDSVVGYQFFDFDAKKRASSAKRGTKRVSSNTLSLVVIKDVPKLRGTFEFLPTRVFAGHLQSLTLKLRNQSALSVKNLKLKVNHPRYLVPADSTLQDINFPQCLEKQKCTDDGAVSIDSKETSKPCVFEFPQDVIIPGGDTLSWPFWFHAGVPGNTSLLISIYYEAESSSSELSYRTLRMHHMVEVLPSLDVSFVISPSQLWLQEYLVRMDITCQASLESFKLHQLSCFENRWSISALASCASICQVETISAGQSLSCFFKVKDLALAESEEGSDRLRDGNESSCSQGSDMLLSSHGNRDTSIDVARSPLSDFHCQERFHQRKYAKVSGSLLDFVLISEVVKDEDAISKSETCRQLLSHHLCHCCVVSESPVWWLMDGPRAVTHDFTSSYYEAKLDVIIHNISSNCVSIRLDAINDLTDQNQSADGAMSSMDASVKQGAWSDISLANDVKIVSSARPNLSQKTGSTPPFIWCMTTSTRLTVKPSSVAKIPLRACFFAPGTYNLSNYKLLWKVQPSDLGSSNGEETPSSGVGNGHAFYLTVLQARKG